MNLLTSLSNVIMGKEVHVLPKAIMLWSRAMTIIVMIIMLGRPAEKVLTNSLGYECRSYVLCYPCKSLFKKALT